MESPKAVVTKPGSLPKGVIPLECPREGVSTPTRWRYMQLPRVIEIWWWGQSTYVAKVFNTSMVWRSTGQNEMLDGGQVVQYTGPAPDETQEEPGLEAIHSAQSLHTPLALHQVRQLDMAPVWWGYGSSPKSHSEGRCRPEVSDNVHSVSSLLLLRGKLH